jgi:c-di-AMP phosphodiesterase-like protein
MGKNIFKWSDTKLYLIIIGLMVGIIAIYEPVLAFIGALVLAYLLFYNYKKTNEKNRELTKYIEGLSSEFDSATKHAIFNMPFPLVIIDESGAITWYNTPFLEMMVEEDLLNERIYELIPNFKLDELLKNGDDTPIGIKYGDNYYKVYSNKIDTKKINNRNKIILLYWVDNTEYIKLEAKHKRENTVISLVYVDNYDDVKGTTPDVNRPLVLAEIDKRIAAYFTRYGGLVNI